MRRILPIIAAAAVVIVVQLACAGAGATYYLTQLTMSAYYAMVVIGLCVLMGYAGQISLGHAGFFAIGGYSSALLTTLNLAEHLEQPLVAALDGARLLVYRTDLYGVEIVHVSPWLAAAVGVVLAALLAVLIGIPALRLRGHYLAMATLGFGIIIHRIVNGTAILGEAYGLSNVPAFELIPGLSISGDLQHRVMNYYLAWGFVLLGLLLALNLVQSRVGRALRTLHGGNDLAEAVGISTSRYKLAVFVISAIYAAIGGVLLTHYTAGIGPGEASIMKSVRYVAIVAVGGMANLWGAIAMALVLNFLSLRGYFGSYDDAVFGGILIVIMMVAPHGVVPRQLLQKIGSLARWRKPRTEPGG